MKINVLLLSFQPFTNVPLDRKQSSYAITFDQAIVKRDVRPAPRHQLTANDSRVDGARSLLISMRFGTSKEGMPIGVQIVGSWQADSTILHIASLLEQVSPVRDLHPIL
jgi:Asp-tRNA(Asn)/Glu-tRNA(Gln) amidotransferase A subunit family amidase